MMSRSVGILVASGQVVSSGGDWALLGELSLSGEVHPVMGVLPMVHTLRRAGARRVGIPAANAAEASRLLDLTGAAPGELVVTCIRERNGIRSMDEEARHPHRVVGG
jgi:magnesium chelatase family protein